MNSYSVWWAHGETFVNSADPWSATNLGESSHSQDTHHDERNDFREMVYDAFCLEDDDNREMEGNFPNQHLDEEPNNQAKAFYDLLHASTIPLGSAKRNEIVLNWLSYMLHTKIANNITAIGLMPFSKDVEGSPLPRLDGVSMRHQVENLPDVLFGKPFENQTIEGFGNIHNWVKRRMRKLKSTIGNKNHVKASIVEAFILYEISHFCSRYFGDDVEISWNQPPRNYGGIGTRPSSVAPDIQQTIDPLMDYNFAPDHENEGPSSLMGKKGRSRNLKGIHPPKNRESKKWVKLTNDKLQFADPNIPRAITSLWKSCFDGPYFTYERVSQSKIVEIYNCFKTLYQWDPADNRHVRDTFLNCMKHRWSDNLRDEKLKWDKNSAYVQRWIPTHIWPQLLTYWDSNEYQRLSARGAKNRSSGERVTHTTRSISFGIHEMRMTESRGGVQPPHQEKFKETNTFKKIGEKGSRASDTYVAECTDSHGSDASSWPRMDNEAWVKAIGGCSSNFMPRIGSQVNPEMVGFTYRKRQPQENLITALMVSDYEETRAKDHEELERQRQQIALIQQQLANMIEAQNSMSQTIAQSVAVALAAHGVSPQAGHHLVAPPQSSHGPGSGLRMNSSFTYSTNSTQTSPMVPEYQQQRQFPPQDEDAYHPTFDPDY
ncbi:hypothetical protein SLEP1_g3806 [Rubroshorea leprosula]|uniref:DUF4218 domain-containing protein n=1 Tax=Rubroshorea leprosula TaxID=152421 RepID=A0AAV5HM58_9ROSI|nr:hypothetical protein SLEP1_g3806 [Rubroshorea leprosula]